MGTSGSKAETTKKIAWAMPSWCIDNYHVSASTVDLANESWRYAMSGETPPFKAAKLKEHSLTPLVFFYNQFYYFLFELLPDTKKLFTKGMKAQGRMLANVIKYIITNLKEKDETILKHSLEHLTRVHNERGITADQYSVMGMCLVHTVRICTGGEFWTNEHRDAWVHIYSKMMSVIIPVVISGDMPEGAETKGTAVASLEYYKQGNMNAEADVPSTSHTPTPPKTGVTKTAVSSCPGSRMGATGADDIELSHDAKSHLQENAAAHLEMLGAEQAAAVAENKYKVLSRVLAIAQRVEAHLRETAAVGSNGHALPQGQITGHQLIQLLHAQNWVSDPEGARMAAAYFQQLHLMSRVEDHHSHGGDVLSSSQVHPITPLLIPVGAGAATSDLTRFVDDDSVYSFINVQASSSTHTLTPPHTAHGNGNGHHLDVTRPAGGMKKSTSTEFAPTCYVSALGPGSILDALSPSTMPGLADVSE